MYEYETMKQIAEAIRNPHTNLATRAMRISIIQDIAQNLCNREPAQILWTIMNLCDYAQGARFHSDQKTALDVICLLIDDHLEADKGLHDPIDATVGGDPRVTPPDNHQELQRQNTIYREALTAITCGEEGIYLKERNADDPDNECTWLVADHALKTADTQPELTFAPPPDDVNDIPF